MTLPEPLTPPDSDISDFGFMPLDVVRFRNSDLVAFEPAESILAALMLWGVSWHSTPAGSLTDDDRSLAQAAGYGRAVKEWQRVREGALRGFVKCSDGRLYHPVVAEKANEAWKAKLRRMWATHCATIRKRNERRPDDENEVTPSFEEWIIQRDTPPMSRVTAAKVTRDTPPKNAPRDREGTGTGKGQGEYIDDVEGAGALAEPSDPFGALGSTTAKLLRAGGVSAPPTKHAKLAAQQDIVRGWLETGLSEIELIEAIEQRVLDQPEERHSLNRFSPMIADIAARKEAQANGRAKQRKPGINERAAQRFLDETGPDVSEPRTLHQARINDGTRALPDTSRGRGDG